jgi:hypothetical protein
VLEGYPVFSVHQHAMGPMILFALGEAAQFDFTPWIYRGLQWINSGNELGFNMEDDAAQVIWRCQYRSASQIKTYLKAALNLGDAARPYEAKKDLKVLYECRPYELGWLLYAFAARSGKSRSGSRNRGGNLEAVASTVESPTRSHSGARSMSTSGVL